MQLNQYFLFFNWSLYLDFVLNEEYYINIKMIVTIIIIF